MIKPILTFISIVSLFGCATSSQTYLPDGRIGYSINCSGSALNMGMCYEKAAEICKNNGYDIVYQNEQNQGYMTTANSFANGYGSAYVNNYYGQANYDYNAQSNYISTPIVNRNLLVACKKNSNPTFNPNNQNEELVFDKSK